MSNRSWFYAFNGQQQGPFPEGQLRDFIIRGTVNADTLVWTEGMSGWQRAGDIPGLAPGGSGPPSVLQPGGSPSAAGSYSGGPLSIDFGILEFVWRSFVLLNRPFPDYSGAVGAGLVHQVDRSVRSGAGTAEPQLRRRRDDDRSVVFWGCRAFYRP